MKVFYTYLWLREDGTPYYVGKGSGKRAFTSKSHSVGRPKEDERIIVQNFESEEDAFFAEEFLVAAYGRLDLGTGCLRNLTAGGIGGISNKGKKHSPEHSRKISESLKGKLLSAEHKLKLSLAKKGKPSSNKGKPVPTEVRKKISSSLIGRKNPHSGHITSEATKKKMSIAHTGKKHRPMSEEGKINMSIAARAREARKVQNV